MIEYTLKLILIIWINKVDIIFISNNNRLPIENDCFNTNDKLLNIKHFIIM